jgi:superfamily II DNA helicase RecQ
MLCKVSLILSLAYALISEAMIARVRFGLLKVTCEPIWHRTHPSISALSLSSTAKSESEIEGQKAVNENLMKNELKLFRKLTAEQQNRPLYSVFPNALIDSIVIVKPRTLDDLARIKGIGPTRLEEYGNDNDMTNLVHRA